MQYAKGDLFSFVGQCDAICITTNGFVKRDGANVMGAGIAKTAKEMFPKIEFMLGTLLKTKGHFTQPIIEVQRTFIVSFPTKGVNKKLMTATDINKVVSFKQGDYKVGDWVPGFHLKSTIGIINDSLIELVHLANDRGWNKVYLPMPGCSNGELTEEEVLPLLHETLDDRFILVRR